MSEPALTATPASADLLAALSTSGPAAFAVDQHGRIAFWNDGAARLLGKSEDDVLGRACHETLRGLDPFGNRYCHPGCAVRAMAREKEPISPFELQLPTPKCPRVAMRITPLRSSGPTDGLFLLVHLVEPIDPEPRPWRSSAARGPRTADPQGQREGCPLSHREQDVLRHLARGLQNKEIAEALGLSPATVRNHVHSALERLGVHTRTEAAWLLRERGWLEG